MVSVSLALGSLLGYDSFALWLIRLFICQRSLDVVLQSRISGHRSSVKTAF